MYRIVTHQIGPFTMWFLADVTTGRTFAHFYTRQDAEAGLHAAYERAREFFWHR